MYGRISNCSSREKTEKERDKKHASTVITGGLDRQQVSRAYYVLLSTYSFLASSNIPRNGSLQGPLFIRKDDKKCLRRSRTRLIDT